MPNIELPSGVTLEMLAQNYSIGATEYSKVMAKARKLDATDNGSLWEAVKAKFPTYQILTDSNYISYVKSNIVASVYSVGKSARLIPTSEEDKTIVETLNIAMDKIWSELDVASYQMQAGERAALLNYGVTQVGWDNSIVEGTGKTFKRGSCALKNIDPMKFMRDPFSTDIETASWCMTWDDYHESIILANEAYKESFEIYKANHSGTISGDLLPVAITDKNMTTKKDYYRVFTHWVNIKGLIHEVHTIDNEWILFVKANIKPSTFPFAELYCNLPANNLFGTSECAKVFSNNLAYNLMLSTLLTSEHKNQRPPKFINAASGLNVQAFTKNGNDADYTFVVQGDASKAVHYHQFPTVSPAATQAMTILSNDIQNITGVDGRYTGRDTGSILTTGGMDSMLNQVTMIDAPKVENYEKYSKRLARIIMTNYLEHSAIKRNYYIQDRVNPEVWKTVTVDFPNINPDILIDYELSISTELPKNKARVESVANHLMEMQMQYQGAGLEVDLITPQEWLMCQDLPMREYMQERMGIQKSQTWQKMVARAVDGVTTGINQGLTPDEAIATTADVMSQQSQPQAQKIPDVKSAQQQLPEVELAQQQMQQQIQ